LGKSERIYKLNPSGEVPILIFDEILFAGSMQFQNILNLNIKMLFQKTLQKLRLRIED
jgi:hypothetical protein